MPSDGGASSRAEPGGVGTALAGLLPVGLPWRLGQQVVSVAEASSTNDLARVLALSGAPEGTVVVADTQTSGRGRLGRAWHSPAGNGLWSSFILRPPVALTGLGPLTLVVAIGARRAALSCGAPDVLIKWPNDLVARGRKLGGILTESAGGNALAAPDFVVVGIGVNVRTPEGGYPEELSAVAVALDELVPGKEGQTTSVEPAQFGRALIEHLSEAYSQFVTAGFSGALHDEWLAANVTTGSEVTVKGGGRTLCGLAEDIDASGRLLVRAPDGRLRAVAAGDVTLRRT